MMPKLKTYKTLTELFSSDLESKVSQHLNSGWELHGAPFISPVKDPDHPGMYQFFHCQVVVDLGHPF